MRPPLRASAYFGAQRRWEIIWQEMLMNSMSMKQEHAISNGCVQLYLAHVLPIWLRLVRFGGGGGVELGSWGQLCLHHCPPPPSPPKKPLALFFATMTLRGYSYIYFIYTEVISHVADTYPPDLLDRSLEALCFQSTHRSGFPPPPPTSKSFMMYLGRRKLPFPTPHPLSINQSYQSPWGQVYGTRHANPDFTSHFEDPMSQSKVHAPARCVSVVTEQASLTGGRSDDRGNLLFFRPPPTTYICLYSDTARSSVCTKYYILTSKP